MTAARKRSGAAVLGRWLPYIVLALVGVALAVAVLRSPTAGAIPQPPDVARDAVNGWRAVAVLDNSGEWSRGVRDLDLKPGEFVVFDYGNPPYRPGFSTAGLPYPVRLFAVGEDGDVVGAGRVLRPCIGERSECPRVHTRVPARFFIQLRPETGHRN